jgi:hypothetical protein
MPRFQSDPRRLRESGCVSTTDFARAAIELPVIEMIGIRHVLLAELTGSIPIL